MEDREIHLKFKEFPNKSELEQEDRLLFEKAIAAAESAYAPYSKFSVGAAVLLSNGEIVKGSNQENIAYPSGLCAERVALFAASANHPGVPIDAVAVTAKLQHQEPGSSVTPCGACRQVILEYERLFEHPVRVITGAIDGPISVFENAKSLLPMAFFDKGIGKE